MNDLEEKINELRGKLPSKGKIISTIIFLVLMLIAIIFSGKIFEDVDANDILVVKAMGTGNLSIYTTPGWKLQLGGDVTHFKKSFQFWFSSKLDQGAKTDQSIRARFNDNGHGNISGSVRIDAPLDVKNITDIYTRYGTQEAVEHELVRTVFEKAVYMAGPLMSSTESASTKRNLLISYIEDQAQNGVYKTTTKDVKTKDPITGAEKTVSVVELLAEKDAPNGFGRQESSPLQIYGFKSSNLSINEVTYDETVEGQIRAQQKAIMDVQIAIAEAKKAEQRVLTVAKEGEAKAATAKWEQEAIKARFVTEAEQKRDVAKLEKDAAEFGKQKNILEGQGESEKRRLIMEADGALQIKVDAVERILGRAYQELGKQKWVPDYVGGSYGVSGPESGSNQLEHFMTLMNANAMKALGIDLSVPMKKKP